MNTSNFADQWQLKNLGGNVTKKEYMDYHETCTKKMVEITKAKNSDYTGIGDDPFANFRAIAPNNSEWILIGFLTRMSDKFSRLKSFVERGKFLVKDENFEDTCMDLANYAILLSGYMKEAKKDNGALEQIQPPTLKPLPQAP